MTHTINTAFTNSLIFTSELAVQGFQRINVSIRIGASFVADPTLSTFSGIITLQRQLEGSDAAASVWRDVAEWSIVTADAMDGGVEVITSSPEPETCKYRLGIKAGDHYDNACFGRLGVS